MRPEIEMDAEMSNVVHLKAPATGSADARERFEKWCCSEMSAIERESIFARTIGGEYVHRYTKIAWLSWQAGIQDLIEQYLADQASPK